MAQFLLLHYAPLHSSCLHTCMQYALLCWWMCLHTTPVLVLCVWWYGFHYTHEWTSSNRVPLCIHRNTSFVALPLTPPLILYMYISSSATQWECIGTSFLIPHTTVPQSLVLYTDWICLSFMRSLLFLSGSCHQKQLFFFIPVLTLHHNLSEYILHLGRARAGQPRHCPIILHVSIYAFSTTYNLLLHVYYTALEHLSVLLFIMCGHSLILIQREGFGCNRGQRGTGSSWLVSLFERVCAYVWCVCV